MESNICEGFYANLMGRRNGVLFRTDRLRLDQPQDDSGEPLKRQKYGKIMLIYSCGFILVEFMDRI